MLTAIIVMLMLATAAIAFENDKQPPWVSMPAWAAAWTFGFWLIQAGPFA